MKPKTNPDLKAIIERIEDQVSYWDKDQLTRGLIDLVSFVQRHTAEDIFKDFAGHKAYVIIMEEKLNG